MRTDPETWTSNSTAAGAITDHDRRVVEGILDRLHGPGGYDAFETQLRV
jgi:hypothetical protein